MHGVDLSHAHDVDDRPAADGIEKAHGSPVDHFALRSHRKVDQHCWQRYQYAVEEEEQDDLLDESEIEGRALSAVRQC